MEKVLLGSLSFSIAFVHIPTVDQVTPAIDLSLNILHQNDTYQLKMMIQVHLLTISMINGSSLMRCDKPDGYSVSHMDIRFYT